MQDLKPQRAVESDSSWHFVGAQCDRADSLDHGQNSPVSFPRAVCSRHFSTGQNKAECATYRLCGQVVRRMSGYGMEKRRCFTSMKPNGMPAEDVRYRWRAAHGRA